MKKIFKQMELELRRIEMLKNTKGLDVDLMRADIKKAKAKYKELQAELNRQYELNN